MKLEATPFNRASELALAIYGQVLDAVRSDNLVRNSIERAGNALFIQGRHIDLSHFDRIWIAGAGKASVPMAKATAEILGERLSGGLIVTKTGSAEKLKGIQVLEGMHPVPDQSSLGAGAKLLEFAQQRDERDLVIFLLSGGASALVESLKEPLTLEDLRQTNKLLLASGADITAMNNVRSRLSNIKAGGLAKAFQPATVIAVVLSDVVGNNLHIIGSGPLMAAKPGTPKLPLIGSGAYPSAVRTVLDSSSVVMDPQIPVEHFVVGSISVAVHAAADAASDVGLKPLPYADPMTGEARVMARKITRHAKERGLENSCMIFGGETTVTVRGRGLGGRCQEMALAAAQPISTMDDVCFLACGTDGIDGPTDAAGGIVDPGSSARSAKAGYKFTKCLAENDGYRFLEACGGLIRTGPTGTNVNDIALLVHAR